MGGLACLVLRQKRRRQAAATVEGMALAERVPFVVPDSILVKVARSEVAIGKPRRGNFSSVWLSTSWFHVTPRHGK